MHGPQFVNPLSLTHCSHNFSDDNRGFLLDAQFPQLVTSILEGYAETLPAISSSQPLSLPTEHLKIIRTAIGALLNLSLNYGKVYFTNTERPNIC